MAFTVFKFSEKDYAYQKIMPYDYALQCLSCFAVPNSFYNDEFGGFLNMQHKIKSSKGSIGVTW